MGLALALALALAMLPRAARGDAIYKCIGATGHVTYQSTACSNGAAIDIAPGTYDDAAAQRLRDDAAEWNKRDDARRAVDAQQEASRRAQQPAAPPAPPVQEAECTYCDGWNSSILWPYVPWRPTPRPPRPRPPPPKPPSYIVIR